MNTLKIWAVLFCVAGVGSEASAFSTSPVPVAQPAADSVKVRHRHRRNGGLFSNWCAYNCYSVPRGCYGGCLGRYGYSLYAYDEDLPFRYRFDRDASPIDNVDAFVYPYTGAPFIRAFERLY
jgi:hypothetical protein